jgi:hypothetical protein
VPLDVVTELDAGVRLEVADLDELVKRLEELIPELVELGRPPVVFGHPRQWSVAAQEQGEPPEWRRSPVANGPQ